MLCKIHNFSIMWFYCFTIWVIRLRLIIILLGCGIICSALNLCNIFKFNFQIMIFSRDFSLKIPNLGQWKSDYICGYIFNYIKNKFDGNIRTFSQSPGNNYIKNKFDGNIGTFSQSPGNKIICFCFYNLFQLTL